VRRAHVIAAHAVTARRFAVVAIALVTASVIGVATAGGQATRGAQHPITFDEFEAVGAVSDAQVSPDGQRVLYAVRRADVAANVRHSATYLIPIGGGAATRFPDDTTEATEARWSPDGSRVAYVAHGQLWVAAADGSGRVALTSLSGGATGPVWAADGSRLAFTSRVYPACDSDACNVAAAHAADTTKVTAHVADQLMYRHWNAWDDGTRSHLFVVAAGGGAPTDLTRGATYDVPPGPFGGSEGYAFAPDGRELAYTAKNQGRADAWSTDVNIYTVPVGGGAPTVITADNRGADQNPVYSPDGRTIAYASQARAGAESDRWRLMLYDRQTKHAAELLPTWDRNADAYRFTPDGASLIVTTVDRGRTKFYRASVAGGTPTLLVPDHNNTGAVMPRDGASLVWIRDAADRPAEVYTGRLGANGVVEVRALTHVNDALVSRLKLYPAEDFWYLGAGGDSVQGFVIKPPQWRAGTSYPAVLLIHGGPQGEWADQWHSRWNYQMFAARGLAVIAINPHGSFGYGQRFVDAVSRDWGGKAYTDLMDGVDAAIVRDPWIDAAHLGAAGGSFGGYMVNWIAGHTDRFKALVSHAGPFNLENMDAATEELWFPEWEYGGPYWDSTAMATQYRVFSPHLYASHFHTPTLVLNGELDFRVPYTEGLSMFSALQRQGIASRLVVFPDEGHWIGKPQNQRLWWTEVQGWLARYLLGVNDSRASQ
jgi:dipeptidyl aminopeptidase/acylaminoacyl peptidase